MNTITQSQKLLPDRILVALGKNAIHPEGIKQYLKDNQFAAGSMVLKNEAVISLLDNGSEHAVIAFREGACKALSGSAGTEIVK